jgi:chromosome partition protein MukB
VHAAACQRKLEAQHVHLVTLQKGLEILRAVPLTEAEVAALETRCSALEASIRHHNEVLDKLTHLVTQLGYFAYADHVVLEQQESGALAVLAQKERLLAASVEQADSAREAADQLRTEADTTKSGAYSAWSDAAATLNSRQHELEHKNCSCDDAALEAARQRVTDSQALHGAARKAEIELNQAQGEVNNQRKAEYRMLAGADHPNNLLTQARTATRAWVRLALEWGEFRGAVQREDAMLHARLQEPEIVAKYQRQSFISLNADLGRLRQELQKTLTASHAVRVLPDQAAARSTRAELLPDWIGVRRYLEQSLPRDITQADNIQKALADITHALEEMRLRQHEQEDKFRTSAESIANSINNLVRREIMNVNRINNDKKLGDVRFGSITGVHIQASRIEHMTRFLDVLRREDDLFSDSRSLEEGLAFLYERSGGGLAQGAALLDYRKYIQVSIQVKRLGQNTWDTNLGTSSGEAIGVGAAILVVILDAMEHQSEMLQRRKVAGSIRFLMLDEANRLDHDSLEMMAGFCKAMSVQLLVAAPEIARARSGTTYCFVRRSGAQGQEVEVTYRGRRGFRAEESA